MANPFAKIDLPKLIKDLRPSQNDVLLNRGVIKIPTHYAVKYLNLEEFDFRRRHTSKIRHEETRPDDFDSLNYELETGYLVLRLNHTLLDSQSEQIDIDDIHPSEPIFSFLSFGDYTLIFPDEQRSLTDQQFTEPEFMYFDDSDVKERNGRVISVSWLRNKWRKYILRRHCKYSIEGCVSDGCISRCDEMRVNAKGNVKGLLCRCGK